MIKTFEQFINENFEKRNGINNNPIDVKSLARKLKPSVDDIVDLIQAEMDEIDYNEMDAYEASEGIHHTDFDTVINGNDYTIEVTYEIVIPSAKRERGVEHIGIHYKLVGFEVTDDNGVSVSNEELRVTEDTFEELFDIHLVNIDD
jgi:hypothetical protein